MSITCPDCHAELEQQMVWRTASIVTKIFNWKRVVRNAICHCKY